MGHGFGEGERDQEICLVQAMNWLTLKPRSWGKDNPLTTSVSEFVTLMLECANFGISSSVNFCFKRLQVSCLSFNLIPEDIKFFEDFSFLQAWLWDARDAWSEVRS